jgi:hypothetical protein
MINEDPCPDGFLGLENRRSSRMKGFGMLRAGFALVAVFTACVCTSPAVADHGFLQGYEDGSRAFTEVEISDKMVVYYHQRMIGEAVVELDEIVYQFDRTGQLLARKTHWRDELPETLPPLSLTRGQAERMVQGDVISTTLYYIDPNSDVFPLDPAPENPCWVIRSVDEGRASVTIIDAVSGLFLGMGVPPPYDAFSMTGPQYYNPCSGAWTSWSDNAETWFNTMGYTTEEIVWPVLAEVEGHVSSTEIAMFYELAHGGSTTFSNGCIDGEYSEDTHSSDIKNWILPYTRMPFAFIGSCDGMCSTGPLSFAYEFRKGLGENTTVVGYCGMSTGPCDQCWTRSLNWQTALFTYMNQGWTVKDAFDQANASVPTCANNNCMRFVGDEDFAVVPLVSRADPVWGVLKANPVGNVGVGRGVAWGDYDNDADLDLYLANYAGGRPNKLIRNDGSDVFVNATTDPLGDLGTGTGVAWGDYDNDGDLDLYLGNYGTANMLFRNDGSGTFADATSGPLGDTGNAQGVSWVDYDLDGDLDLYVANHGQANRLLRNDGAGVFTDATSGPLGDTGNNTGAAWGDYDNDGDPDLYLANDGGANVLVRNDGGGSFADATHGPLGGGTGSGMGVAWGDYDNDGDLDLYLANFGSANHLFRNDSGTFVDVTAGPLGDAGDGRCVAWGDYDNDGDLDLFVSNDSGVNRLFGNAGGGTFVDVTSGPVANTGSNQGAAWGDYDADGDLDLYVSESYGRNTLVRNDLSTGNHWLHIELVGTVSNQSGIGARVEMVSASDTQIREVNGGSGFLSENSLTVEFGLGSDVLANVVEVTWPSGVVDVQYNVPADQIITIVEDEGTPVAETPLLPARLALHGNVPNPFNPMTVIHYELPGSSPVGLRIYDVSGRLVRTLLDSAVQHAGHHTQPWDGRDDRGRPVASGVYFYCLQAEGKVLTERMVLTK